VAWLLASMSPSVSKMVEAMRTVTQIWKTLSNMYSKRGNVMMMMIKIQSKTDAVKQARRSVEQYASELQYLWGSWITMLHSKWRLRMMLGLYQNGWRIEG
jgi:hypothetical protein